MPNWAAALIVTALWGAVAGFLALRGRDKVQEVGSPAPREDDRDSQGGQGIAERSDEIRSEIERTRDQMGETVETLEYKANVPARAKGWVADKKDSVVSSVSGAKDSVADATPNRQAVQQRAGALRGTAEQNPLGLAIAGAAVGFLAGMLVPSTRIEDERVGPMADQVKSSASEAASEALDRGKQVAQEVAGSAVETAKEEGSRQGEELSASLRGRARDTASSVAESGS